jgi:phospholipase C
MPLSDIETIVIVIMENRSFDHMLGYLSLPGPNRLDVEGLTNDPTWRAAHANYDGTTRYDIQPITQQAIDDPPHEQATIAIQINTPPQPGAPSKMGGFVTSYLQRTPAPQNPALVMGYYTAPQVPTFDFFARQFVVCDHWFAALPTGTQANRLMAMSGESRLIDNATLFLPEQDLVYDWLTRHQVRWCVYQAGDFFPFFSLMPRWLGEITTSLTLSALGGRGRFRRYAQFDEQWRADAPMPQVIFIEPAYTDGPHHAPNDDHPPTGIAAGQAFLADIYATMIANPRRWQNTLMLVTYDEHGGFFDHVEPPPMPTTVAGFQFTTTGVRVPAFVISPHVQPGTVFRGTLDHTSLLQLLADRFHPGQTYSAAVAARQAPLSRVAEVLLPAAPPVARAPVLPPVPAPSAPVTGVPQGGFAGAPGATANAQAFHQVALKVAQDHPDLLASPGWAPLATYVHAAQGVP